MRRSRFEEGRRILPDYSGGVLPFDMQVRRYASPTTRAETIPASNVTFTTVDGDAAVLTMSVSEVIAGALPTPFYAAVELLGESGWVKPRNDLYVFHDKGGDQKDPTGMRTFTGVLWAADRAGRTFITEEITVDELKWVGASAGGVMDSLLELNPATGIGHSTFTPTVDSNGNAWAAGDKTDHTARAWQSYGQVLTMLTQGAYCQWYTQGTELMLVRPGSGQDLTQSVPIGPNATSVDVRESTADTASKFYVVTDTGVATQVVTRPELGAGPREAIVTVSGAATAEAAMRMALPIIDAASQVRREITVTYAAENLPARPLIDFQLGDLFTVNGGQYRLVGVQVTKSESAVEVRLSFGQRFLGLITKLAARAAQISLGSLPMSGGSGQPITPGVVKPKVEPVAPIGLRVASNVGKVRSNGAPYAEIRLEWDPVTSTALGADTAVSLYEVWVAVGDASAAPTLERVDTFAEVEWSGEPRTVYVRAFNGAWSALSDPLEVTPASPVHDTTPPAMPTLVATPGGVIIEWNGELATGPVGPSFWQVYAEIAAEPSGPWTRVGAPLTGEGQVASVRGVVGTDIHARLVWVDTSGRPSTPSPVAVMTVTGLTPDDIDSIPDFWADQAWIENARVNVLKAGTIEVDMLAPNVGELINIEANEGLLIVTERVEELEAAAQFYRFGPQGAIIGRAGDPTTFEFRNDEASFNVNGVEVTTWGPTGMDVPRLSADSAVIGNLQFEVSGNRTIVRVVQT